MRLSTLGAALVFLIAIIAMEEPVQAQVFQDQFPKKSKTKGAPAKEKEVTSSTTLEDLLGQALKNNPDLRVAEAKLHEAEVELQRARLLVTQKVLAQQRDIALSKAAMEDADAQFRRAQQLQSNKAISMEEFKAVELRLQKMKADLARVEVDLIYLLGSSPVKTQLTGEGKLTDLVAEVTIEGVNRLYRDMIDKKGTFPSEKSKAASSYVGWVRSLESRLPASTADKLLKALDTTIKVDFDKVVPEEILDYLRDRVKGFNLVIAIPMKTKASGAGAFRSDYNVPPATLKLQEPVPVGAIFQFLEDQYGWRFVVREYGIVVTEKDRVPPGAIHLQDFWRNRTAPTMSGPSTPAPAITPPQTVPPKN